MSVSGKQKSLMGYVLIDRREKDRFANSIVLRGRTEELSNNFLHVARVKMVCRFVK